MSLSKLAEKCKNCPNVEFCDHKEMEAVGFLPGEPTMEQIVNGQKRSVVMVGGAGTGVTIGAVGHGKISLPDILSSELTIEVDVKKLEKSIYGRMGVSSTFLNGGNKS